MARSGLTAQAIKMAPLTFRAPFKRAAWNVTPPICGHSPKILFPIGLTAVCWCLESAVRPAMGQARSTRQSNISALLTQQRLETNQYSIPLDFPATGNSTYAHGV